jgi:prepilin-type N-terminal cleavage/methylation domain-containing protein
MRIWTHRTSGFTLVELVFVIAVIAILVAITTLGYSSMLRSSAQSAMINDLNNAANILEYAYMKDKTYPSSLPSSLRPSRDVRLTVGTSQYIDLSASQNALILYDTCKQMLSEGKGKTTSNGGTTVDIVSDCIIYTNNGYFHINGWSNYLGSDTVKLQVPISGTDLANRAAAITYYDSYYPGGTTTAKNFLTELDQRFRTLGGSYPITVLWDQGGSPVAKPTLPALPPGGGSLTPSNYCVQARHLRYSDLTWYIRPDNKPVEGTCS